VRSTIWSAAASDSWRMALVAAAFFPPPRTYVHSARFETLLHHCGLVAVVWNSA